jgi:hypothetical protein
MRIRPVVLSTGLQTQKNFSGRTVEKIFTGIYFSATLVILACTHGL